MSNRNSRNSEGIEADRAIIVAESMRKDFVGLIAILEAQLADEPKSASGIVEARTAAERGLRLSEELVELLRRAQEAAFEQQAESTRGFR